jgi:hypothetical protein
MQICKDHLATTQLLALGSKRLFNLHDQCGFFEYAAGSRVDAGACGGVFVVAYARAIPGAAFNGNIMAFSNKLRDVRGYETNPIFFRLDLPWNANQHEPLRLELSIPLPGLWAQIADAKLVAN